MKEKLIKLSQTISVTFLLLFLIVFGGVVVWLFPGKFGLVRENAKKVNYNNDKSFDLKMPGEVEKRVVTKDEVEVKLEELSQFSTYSGKYEVEKEVEQKRYLLDDFQIPLTKNTISVKCNGIVKVGYDFSEIGIKVDDEKIYISIPDAEVQDNYVIWDTIDCTEGNNFLNPIEFSQYQELIEEIEEEGLEEVEKTNIYEEAENNLRKLIEEYMSEFEDYEVVYM